MEKIKILTPLKSIRKFCLWCSNDQSKEIRLCPSTECPFYPFRMGKKTIKGVSLVKVINKKCKDCGEGTWKAIKDCEFPDCQIYPYRNGKSPAHQASWANRHKTDDPSKNRGLVG